MIAGAGRETEQSVSVCGRRRERVGAGIVRLTVGACACGRWRARRREQACDWLTRAHTADTVRYLVDPASSHMLVLKIKPCMCTFKPLYGETADGSLYQ